MTDPYHSLKPVVNSIAGFFISVTMVTIPFVTILGVKSPYEGLPPKLNGDTTQANSKRALSAVDAGWSLWIPDRVVFSGCADMCK